MFLFNVKKSQVFTSSDVSITPLLRNWKTTLPSNCERLKWTAA